MRVTPDQELFIENWEKYLLLKVTLQTLHLNSSCSSFRKFQSVPQDYLDFIHVLSGLDYAEVASDLKPILLVVDTATF